MRFRRALPGTLVIVDCEEHSAHGLPLINVYLEDPMKYMVFKNVLQAVYIQSENSIRT